MDDGGQGKLVILVQAGQDAREPMYLYQLELPRADAPGARPTHIPCG